MMRFMRHFKRAVIVVTAWFSIPGLAAAQPALVVDNVTVIDGTGHVPVSGVTIVVEGDRFVAVGRGVDAPMVPATSTDPGSSRYLASWTCTSICTGASAHSTAISTVA